jgi:cell division inhibitor SepF
VVQRNARDWFGLAGPDHDDLANKDWYADEGVSEYQDDDEDPSGSPGPGNGLHIAIVRPRNFRDAATVGEYYRQEIPVIINLEDVDNALATRIIDFVSGLILGLHGDIERLSRRAFLIVPAGAAILTARAGLTEEGFFNQALRPGPAGGPALMILEARRGDFGSGQFASLARSPSMVRAANRRAAATRSPAGTVASPRPAISTSMKSSSTKSARSSPAAMALRLIVAISLVSSARCAAKSIALGCSAMNASVNPWFRALSTVTRSMTPQNPRHGSGSAAASRTIAPQAPSSSVNASSTRSRFVGNRR